jgi:2,3-bisphosphoglycerate-independent phosphoglycerate mutase
MFKNFLELFRKKRTGTKKPYVLLILDGYGIAPASAGNAITSSKKPNIDMLFSKYINTQLIASGEMVGLSANDKGNTEVGHLTIGAGRVVLQDLKRISEDIKNGRFFYNPAFLQASNHIKKNNSKLHIMGLLGSGVTHASTEHLMAILKFCKSEGMEKVFLHLFTDGRDSKPKEAADLIAKLENELAFIGVGKIATIGGRYYGMDRDSRWDRTEKAYKALVKGEGVYAKSPAEALQISFKTVLTDEFVEPTVILGNDNKPIATIDDNDAAIFYNFRTDRPKQLSIALCDPNFEGLKSYDFGYDPEIRRDRGEVKIDKTFDRQKIVKNLFLVTMTEYQKGLPVSAIAFPPTPITNPLGVVLEQNNKLQFHMSESEKQRFVTYYFNGLREKPLNGEEDVIVPSLKVRTYDLRPIMALPKLLNEFNRALDKDKYDFYVINFANPDMVAHTGNLPATIKAIEHVDYYVNEIVRNVLELGGVLFLTADHGNAEELINYGNVGFFVSTEKGQVDTDHSNYPVPFLIVGNGYEKEKVDIRSGALSDVAPTILEVMGIPIDSNMTGKSLLSKKATQTT